MKHRREHAALWCSPRISQRKIHFQIMLRTLLNVSSRRNKQSLNVVHEPVHFGRHPGGSRNLNQRPRGELLHHLIVVEFQSSNPRRKHGSSLLLKKWPALNPESPQKAERRPARSSMTIRELVARQRDLRAPPSNTSRRNTTAAPA